MVQASLLVNLQHRDTNLVYSRNRVSNEDLMAPTSPKSTRFRMQRPVLDDAYPVRKLDRELIF